MMKKMTKRKRKHPKRIRPLDSEHYSDRKRRPKKMEYVYTAMLLHSAGTEVSAKSVEKVLKAAGVKADKSRAEALVASLEGVDIEEAMATAAVAAPAASGAAPAAAASEEAPAEEAEEEEEEVSEEDTAAGLGALFG
jgi:large subunit ribosomal protein L12